MIIVCLGNAGTIGRPAGGNIRGIIQFSRSDQRGHERSLRNCGSGQGSSLKRSSVREVYHPGMERSLNRWFYICPAARVISGPDDKYLPDHFRGDADRPGLPGGLISEILRDCRINQGSIDFIRVSLVNRSSWAMAGSFSQQEFVGDGGII